GLSTSSEEKKMGLDGSSTRSVILDNVHVPVHNVIGEIGRGHIIAFNVLNLGRHKIALSSLGSAKRALELAVSYGNTRHQFNQPLTSFNLIKEKIANMLTQCVAVESVLYRTAGELEESFLESSQPLSKIIANYAMHCSINKVMATEAVGTIVDEALQIHGGYGYMREYEIETIYRDVRINRIFEGTNEINRILIASTIMKEYESDTVAEGRIPNGPLEKEHQKLALSRKLLREFVDTARHNGLADMNEQQEVAAVIADTIMAIYAMDSLLARAEKIGEGQNEVIEIATKIFVHETAQQLGIRALNYMNHLGNEGQFSKIASLLITSNSNNLVLLKRQLADAAINL
ncbi:MAG TPA: acyl-CoA dehydrogenase family protein, partial [Ureibacillus sp.]|nr:acyl-CoA dehydrogenase family protein [Ureibacillus sp.]